MDKAMGIIEEKNRLCNEFAIEWGKYFDDHFPWHKLDWQDAYITVLVTASNLLVNYNSDDLETALVTIDTCINSMRDRLISMVKSTMDVRESGE